MNCTYMSDLGLTSSHHDYLSQIKEDSLLTATEEKELAEAIARGDINAKNRMIRANLRLVVKIAREYGGRGLMLDDLIGEGNLGLIRAAEEFDPRFGTRFSTYASYWIKQSIRHALINTTATIRLPAHMIGLMTKWRRMERQLTRQFGFAPSADEIANQLGLTETQKSLISKARRASQLKLESSFSDEGNNWSLNKSDDSEELPESRIEAHEDQCELFKKLGRLDDRERAILTYRFGLNGETALTLKEVGKRLGVTREWVRKIEIRALRKLSDDDINNIVPAKTRSRRVKAVEATIPVKAATSPKVSAPLKTAPSSSKPSTQTVRQEPAAASLPRFHQRDGIASFRRKKLALRQEAVPSFS